MKYCFQSHGCTVKETDFDLISAVHTLLTKISSSWTWQHLLGHQDDDATTVLDWWAQLNVIADFYAQPFNRSTSHLGNFERPIVGEVCPLFRENGSKVTSASQETVSFEISKKNLEDYWVEKDRISREHIPAVDLQCLAKSMK